MPTFDLRRPRKSSHTRIWLILHGKFDYRSLCQLTHHIFYNPLMLVDFHYQEAYGQEISEICGLGSTTSISKSSYVVAYQKDRPIPLSKANIQSGFKATDQVPHNSSQTTKIPDVHANLPAFRLRSWRLHKTYATRDAIKCQPITSTSRCN